MKRQTTRVLTFLVVLLAVGGLCQDATSETITLRSGNDSNGDPLPLPTVNGPSVAVPNDGILDAKITYDTNEAWGALPLDFVAARTSGYFAEAIVPHPAPGWIPSLPADPDARWIHFNHRQITAQGSGRPFASVLYAHEFTITSATVAEASIQLHWAVDDRLGDWGGGNVGAYINEIPLDLVFRGGSASAVTTANQTGLEQGYQLSPGLNYLYVYQRDVGGTVSGIIYSATITIVPEPGTVVMLIGAGLIGLLAYARRRRKR
jgi:hypothetical protein